MVGFDFRKILSGFHGNEKEDAEKISFCSHRREHLYKDEEDKKHSIKKKFFCKDSSIVYSFGRKINLTQIDPIVCKNCEVLAIEHLIGCSKLGFFKINFAGRLINAFVCKDKGRLNDPAKECGECKKSLYIA